VRAASWSYPNRDAGLAEALLIAFVLPPDRRVQRLSREMRSALGIHRRWNRLGVLVLGGGYVTMRRVTV
jgi:hypothetical protein